MDYLLTGVLPHEYETLKKEEPELVSQIFESFNDHWKSKVRGISMSFKYNSKRALIGIFLKKDSKETMITDSEKLSLEEHAIAEVLYTTLQKRLEEVRILNDPVQDWQ